MGIFTSKASNPPPSGSITDDKKSPNRNEAISSVIATEMEIIGELRFRGKARIDGKLQGNLHGEALVLSESGCIEGDMILDNLICHGSVTGNITAKTVTVHSTAHIEGKLIADSLTVEPGALLSGEISAATQQTEKTKQEIPVLKGPQKVISASDENGKKGGAVSAG